MLPDFKFCSFINAGGMVHGTDTYVYFLAFEGNRIVSGFRITPQAKSLRNIPKFASFENTKENENTKIHPSSLCGKFLIGGTTVRHPNNSSDSMLSLGNIFYYSVDMDTSFAQTKIRDVVEDVHGVFINSSNDIVDISESLLAMNMEKFHWFIRFKNFFDGVETQEAAQRLIDFQTEFS